MGLRCPLVNTQSNSMCLWLLRLLEGNELKAKHVKIPTGFKRQTKMVYSFLTELSVTLLNSRNHW